MTTRVKICGLTDEAAVQAVAAAKADYAGFVYFPASPRHLTLEKAASLKALLPASISSVSVLVNPDDALLKQVSEILKPNAIQLHGKETPERVREIKKQFPALKIIKAISVGTGDDIASANRYVDAVDMLMFDAKILSLSPWERVATPHLVRGCRVRANEYEYSPKKLIENARDLRKNGTDAEALIWYFLRNRQIAGYKFRRQYPIEPYIADFACLESKLIIELDGSQHNEDAAIKKDAARTAYLESKGFKVIRFWNNDIFQNTESVLDAIWNALQQGSPHPNPLPEGEGINYLPGGNGLAFDWILLKHREFAKPWFLSGGLNADNVRDAIAASGAAMVDVSSGVETAPGKKDAGLITEFVKAVRTI
jgi:phosphoribosylanthranilate isomerase/very-short-patch-repair endonuclease